MNAPTIDELYDAWQEEIDGYELVDEEFDRDDHGYVFTYVFKRLEDDTYWSVCGVRQGGGDYHQFHEKEAIVDRVYPHTKTVVKYYTRIIKKD